MLDQRYTFCDVKLSAGINGHFRNINISYIANELFGNHEFQVANNTEDLIYLITDKCEETVCILPGKSYTEFYEKADKLIVPRFYLPKEYLN